MSTIHRIRNAVRRLGIDIARYPAGWSGPQLVQLLNAHGTSIILDVGANEGEYGALLRENGYRGRIISFEPLSDPCRVLRRRARADASWTVLPYALGDRTDTATMNISGNRGASSSILAMLELHADAAPHARYVATERVPVRRLDELWPELVSPGERVFLKVDVQGYEAHVLRGAGSYLKECHGLQIETSFVPLYEGSMVFADAVALIDTLGLTVMAVIPGFTHPRTGQMLQCDLVLIRAADGARAGPVPRPDRPRPLDDSAGGRTQ